MSNKKRKQEKSKSKSARRFIEKPALEAANKVSRKKSSFPSTNFVSWTIVFLSCCLYAVVWTLQLKEVKDFTSNVSESILFRNYEDDRNRVLGAETDDTQVQTGESDIDTLIEEPADGNESADGEGDAEVVAEAENADEESAEGSADDEIVSEVVDDIEQERKQELRDELKLQLPREIDNPNYPVTFVPPTEESTVELQIDGGGFEEIESPFLLPSLSIGMHSLNFRFEDEDDVTQNFEEKIIIIPREPKLEEGHKAEFRSDEVLTFTGTALPNSSVVVVVGGNLVTKEVAADGEGNWTAEVDAELETGEHSVIFMSKKFGYASSFSEPFTFSLGTGSGNVETDDIDNYSNNEFSFDINSFVTEDNYLHVLGGFAGLTLVLLLLITFLSRRLSKKGKHKVDLEGVLNKASKDKDGDLSSGITLREKFAKAGMKVAAKNDSDEDHQKTSDSRDSEKNEEPEKGKDEKKDKKDKKSKSHKESSSEKPRKKKSKKDSKKKSDKDEKAAKDKKVKPVPGKIYKKSDFLERFKEVKNKDTNNISITLTSRKDKKGDEDK
jgi:hypothetical protein